MFKRVSVEIDGELPRGESWHRDLLTRMANSTDSRPAVLTAETAEHLKEYLHFRHFFRSSYASILQWEKVAPLAAGVADVLGTLESELRRSLACGESSL